MHAHLGTRHHKRIAHIIAGVTHIRQPDALQMPEMLSDGQQIRQHLRRMKLIRQTVPHRHTGIFRQFLHDLLPETAVLDPLKHASQHPRGIRYTLLLADLRSRRVQISRTQPQIMCRHFKRAACSGACLLKDQRHILAAVNIDGNALLLFILQVCRHIQHVCNFLRRKIQKL